MTRLIRASGDDRAAAGLGVQVLDDRLDSYFCRKCAAREHLIHPLSCAGVLETFAKTCHQVDDDTDATDRPHALELGESDAMDILKKWQAKIARLAGKQAAYD